MFAHLLNLVNRPMCRLSRSRFYHLRPVAAFVEWYCRECQRAGIA